jgi:hypothetical protein
MKHLEQTCTADLYGSKRTNRLEPQPQPQPRQPTTNPWLPHLQPRPDPQPTAPPARPETPSSAPLTPQPGVPVPDAADQLPRRQLAREELLTPIWWIGAHGGAGETTLERLLLGSRAANHAWPVSPDLERPARTMLVARTSYTGLLAAQRALQDWGSGSVPAQLDGLVLIADAPGKLPKELRALVGLITSIAPGSTWELPWQAEWRLGPPTLERASRQTQQLLHHLNHHKEA